MSICDLSLAGALSLAVCNRPTARLLWATPAALHGAMRPRPRSPRFGTASPLESLVPVALI